MWYVTLIDFLILNHSCIPGINLSWSWFMFLLIYCWIWLVTLYWGILHLCSLVILVCNLLFVWYIGLILESVWCWFCRMILETFFPLHSSWIVCESVKFCQNDWAQFCQNLSEFTCNNMVLDFLRNYLITVSISLLLFSLFIFFTSILVLGDCTCIGICPLSLGCQFYLSVLSHFSHVWLFITLWILACQAPCVHGSLQAEILKWVPMPSFCLQLFLASGSFPMSQLVTSGIGASASVFPMEGLNIQG